MNGVPLIPVFLIGLLGSVHCVGMCGGIVGAFSSAPGEASRRHFPVAVVSATQGAGMNGAGATQVGDFIESSQRALAYNAGRIASYALAGALAGGAAGGAGTLTGVPALQIGGYWLANLMLVALGLYLTGAWHGLARLEAAGKGLWRRVQPLMRHLLPLDRWWKVLALGGLWGWLPCGMVYGVLVTAMFSGSAASGAAVMLAFGLGTLPMLLTISLFGQQVRVWSQRRTVRLAGGLVVLAFGLIGLARAAGGLPTPWLAALCIGAPVSDAAVLR